jgi:AraC family transcriptional activator FtrA
LSQPGSYPVDYDAMAARLGMATSTLRRKFREATGQSPHHYALAARTAEARRLLLETSLPVKAIAARLGFTDVHFFTRQFGRFVGVPPATFRRNLRSFDASTAAELRECVGTSTPDDHRTSMPCGDSTY